MGGIVPVNGDSAEEGTSPVNGDGVEFLQGLDDVVGVLFPNVLESKVSNNKGESMGLVSCLHSAGVLGTGSKPNWAR